MAHTLNDNMAKSCIPTSGVVTVRFERTTHILRRNTTYEEMKEAEERLERPRQSSVLGFSDEVHGGFYDAEAKPDGNI